MQSQKKRMLALIARPTRRALATAAIALAFSGAALAQENLLSPPAALQFPFEAQPSAVEFPLGTLRTAVELSVDLALCKALMTVDGRPIPNPFRREDCPPAYAQRVAANQGAVHWASANARPSNCGLNCFGHPSMGAEDQRNRPNLRRAGLSGRIALTIDSTVDRDITYSFDARFTCKAANGAREGDLTMLVKFDRPVIGEAGIVESVISNVFTADELSRYIESEIRRQLPSIGSRQSVIGRCRSVGVFRSEDPTFDAIKFDRPGNAPRGPRGAAAAGALPRDQARIEFLRIVRHPLPALVDQGHGRPGDPFSGQFNVFVNGASHFFPPQGLVLPVAGGAAPINFCTTVDVTDWDRLQILFTNDLGGAAWSQFPRTGGFGQGALRTLTTGRTIVVPGSPGLPDPITGRPRPPRPQTVLLREFELTYRVTFTGRPVVAQPATPGRPVRPGLAGSIVGTRPTLAVDPTAPPSQPCRQI